MTKPHTWLRKQISYPRLAAFALMVFILAELVLARNSASDARSAARTAQQATATEAGQLQQVDDDLAQSRKQNQALITTLLSFEKTINMLRVQLQLLGVDPGPAPVIPPEVLDSGTAGVSGGSTAPQTGSGGSSGSGGGTTPQKTAQPAPTMTVHPSSSTSSPHPVASVCVSVLTISTC